MSVTRQKRLSIAAIVIVAALLMASLMVMVASGDSRLDHEYPGFTGSGSIDLAARHVEQCTTQFYRVHQRWPANWQEVVDDQLCQVPLVSPTGNSVDPDDGNIDFSCDVLLCVANGDAFVKYMTGREVIERRLEAVPTYEDQLKESADTTGMDEFLAIAEDTDQLRLFALLFMCKPAIQTYCEKYGELPETWQDLLDSGLLPYNGGSINPKSGQPMSATTGPWGIVYQRVDSDTYKLRHLDENGEPVRLGISY